MKRIVLLVVVIIVISIPALCTIHTVCNMPYGPGQYNNFSSAQTVASSGDTIYVHGSSFSYGNVTIYVHDLVVIGAGFKPNKQLPLTTSFGEIAIQASGVQLIGLIIDQVFTISFSSNTRIRKCRFLGSGPGGSCLSLSNGVAWIIEGCIIDAPNVTYAFDMGNNAGSHVVQHNIFALDAPAILGMRGTAGNPAYVLNNVFLGDGASFDPAISNSSQLVIRNNIFNGIIPYGASDVPGGSTIVERNMVYGTGDDTFYPIGLYPDNYAGENPQFNSYNGASTPYSFANDFTLFSGSLGNDYGTDGTDVGVFGGIGEIFTATGEPSIAEVTAFDITSPTTVAPGGTLTISVTSKRIK